MNIVIDTNVVVSGVFFGGAPRQVVVAVAKGAVAAFATTEIVDEYNETVAEMIARRQGILQKSILAPFISKLNFVASVTKTDICRDPDDNKFLSCAKDSRSSFIVSGDNDLLVLKAFEGIQIVTAKEFCALHLP